MLALVNKGGGRRRFMIYTGGLALGAATPSVEGASLAQRNEERKNITGWLARYNWEDAVQSALRNSRYIETLSPAWYEILPGGRIRAVSNSNVDDERLHKATLEKGMRLRPLIGNVSPLGTLPEVVRPLLARENKEHRLQHHRRVRSLASGYDGISLDYEGLRLPDMPGFVRFVEETWDALHGTGKTLSVCLEALPGEEILGHWRRIADSTDTVYLMAYGQKPKTPGPFVTLSWLDEVVQRAVKAIPPHKLVVGLAVYGLSWSEQKGVTSGTWQQYLKRAHMLGAPLERDTKSGMTHFRIGTEDTWVEDGTSIDLKMRVGWRAGARRFAFWRLGGEDPQIWSAVDALPS